MTIWLLALSCLLGCSPESADDPARGTVDTANEIIEECLEAYGGAEKINALRSFRMHESWDGNSPIIRDIQRPNLMRVQTRQAVLLFDGTLAAISRNLAEGDSARAWEVLDSVKDFEIELAFRFPAFFDYRAEYVGKDSVLGKEAHILTVELPLGSTMTYAIDTVTYLPLKVSTEIHLDGTDYTPEVRYIEFEEVDGILFPKLFQQGWTPETAQNAVVPLVEVNHTIPTDHFIIPQEL